MVLVGDSSSLQTASQQIPCEEDDIHVLHLDLLTSILSIQSRVEDVVEKAWHVFGGFDLFVTFSSFTGLSFSLYMYIYTYRAVFVEYICI